MASAFAFEIDLSGFLDTLNRRIVRYGLMGRTAQSDGAADMRLCL
jgi:hypothetical protein